MSTLTLLIVWGAVALVFVLLGIFMLVLRQRTNIGRRQARQLDAALRSRWTREGRGI